MALYSQLIEIAQETLAENRRLRVRTTELRAEVTAILFRYCRNRFPQFSGASDAGDTALPSTVATDVATMLRNKVRSGLLPFPPDPPEKCYVGKGTRRPCDGCDVVIRPDEIEYELDVADGRVVRFHAECLAAWHAARAERLTTPEPAKK